MKMIATLALAALAMGPALAAEAPPAAAQFGAREAIQQISLSPDGARLAFIAPREAGGEALYVADLAAGTPRAIMSSRGFPETLRSCRWSGDTRLVCSIYIIDNSSIGRLGFTRTIAINADGSGLKLLTQRAGANALGLMQDGGAVIDWTAADGRPGVVLMTRQFVPEETTGHFTANRREGLGVDEVDTVTLARRTIEPPRRGAVEYIADGRGTVRIMGVQPGSQGGYISGRLSYLYRKPGSRDWLPLSVVEDGGGFDPYAVDPDLNVVYGFERHDGRRALYKVALDGSMRKELVLARPDVDVDGLIRVGRQRRVVGTSYAVERREVQFFDQELARLGASLSRALPGVHNTVFVDATADEKTLLLFIGGDAEPGRYYLYRKANRHLEEVAPVRPQLAGQRLATVQPITFKAADGTAIPAYLTLPAGGSGKDLPAIVMPHGGPGDRDEWGFDWLVQFYAARGFAVLQPEYRGSAGYGQAWFQRNGFQSWRTAIGDVNDAGRYLLSSGIAAPGKLAIVGWSYGGYAALQSAVLDPDLFKAIVAVAPVTDLPTLREEHRNFDDYQLVARFIGAGPGLREGSPAQNASRIRAPVLLFHGDQDQNVGVGESRLMAARLRGAGKAVQYVEFHNLDHQLDDNGARTRLLAESDAFLRTTLGL